MDLWEEALYSVVNPNTDFGGVLRERLDELNVSVPEFCADSELSESTVYKIMSENRDNLQLKNFQLIIRSLKQLEQGGKNKARTIAVITNREALEQITGKVTIDGRVFLLEGYPCSTVEEAIRKGVIAERDGVEAIICGPITAYTIETIIHTPVVGLDIRPEQIREAVETVTARMENS